MAQLEASAMGAPDKVGSRDSRRSAELASESFGGLKSSGTRGLDAGFHTFER